MDASLEKLKAKIEKLKTQQQEKEEKYINSVAHLVKDITTTKSLDLSILTGMILNASEIITQSPANKEAWQAAGQKFLLRAKNQNAQKKRANSKN